MPSLYDITVPVLTKLLETLQSTLKIGEAYAKEKSIPTADLLATRIYEDMLPLKAQIIIAVNTSKRALERLTGGTFPQVEGREQNWEELLVIVDETIKQVAGVSKESLEGKEDTPTLCKFAGKDYTATAVAYVQGYAVPTVFFHLDMTYAILRGKGVPLGKSDYLTAFVAGFELA